MFIPTPTCFYRKKTRRLMLKVRDWSGRARSAHHGVSGPGFNNDGLETHASHPAPWCLRNVHVRGPFSGVCLKKHATGLASGTDKSSSLSRHETGSRNQQHYSQPGRPARDCLGGFCTGTQLRNSRDQTVAAFAFYPFSRDI
jgi:hypothetical protein